MTTAIRLDVERDGNDALVARFTYSPGYIDAVGVQERDLNADDDFGETNEVVYYHQNTLFSVYALSDSAGSVVERYRYDAYGGCTVLDPDGSVDGDGLSDVKNPYTFTGRRLDPESGLMQYRHRYYSPVLGRFVSRDPPGYADGPNSLAYARARWTIGSDPSGTSTTVEVGNPRLPHYFEPYPGLPAVITGTIWEVYDWKNRTIFREGIAGIAWPRRKCGGGHAKDVVVSVQETRTRMSAVAPLCVRITAGYGGRPATLASRIWGWCPSRSARKRWHGLSSTTFVLTCPLRSASRRPGA